MGRDSPTSANGLDGCRRVGRNSVRPHRNHCGGRIDCRPVPADTWACGAGRRYRRSRPLDDHPCCCTPRAARFGAPCLPVRRREKEIKDEGSLPRRWLFASAVPPRAAGRKSIGAAFGERLTRFYEYSGSRFVLVFERFERNGEVRVRPSTCPKRRPTRASA